MLDLVVILRILGILKKNISLHKIILNHARSIFGGEKVGALKIFNLLFAHAQCYTAKDTPVRTERMTKYMCWSLLFKKNIRR